MSDLNNLKVETVWGIMSLEKLINHLNPDLEEIKIISSKKENDPDENIWEFLNKVFRRK